MPTKVAHTVQLELDYLLAETKEAVGNLDEMKSLCIRMAHAGWEGGKSMLCYQRSLQMLRSAVERLTQLEQRIEAITSAAESAFYEEAGIPRWIERRVEVPSEEEISVSEVNPMCGCCNRETRKEHSILGAVVLRAAAEEAGEGDAAEKVQPDRIAVLSHLKSSPLSSPLLAVVVQ